MSNFNNIPDVILQIEEITKESLKEIGVTVKANMQSNCVVGKNTPSPGNLRRSHAYKVGKDHVKVGITPNAPYGVYVEFKPYSKGGRPWMRKTVQTNIPLIKSIITKHLGGIK